MSGAELWSRWLPRVDGPGRRLAVTMVVGLVWGFFFTPDDFRQGSTVKIIYLHVPSAMVTVSAETGCGSGATATGSAWGSAGSANAGSV